MARFEDTIVNSPIFTSFKRNLFKCLIDNQLQNIYFLTYDYC